MNEWAYNLVLFVTGIGAGSINALAGGGPILTLGFLSLSGLDPRIANLTSTVALSPGQLAAGLIGRHRLREVRLAPPFLLVSMAVTGGAVGAIFLLITSAPAFQALVPWLVLLATGIYAASGPRTVAVPKKAFANNRFWSALFAPLTIYGGYFGGGNSFLVLALLGLSGHETKPSGEIKNVLIAAINLGAVIVFCLSGLVNWQVTLSLGAGGILGSIAGARLLGHLPVVTIRAIVIAGGLLLTGLMFAT